MSSFAVANKTYELSSSADGAAHFLVSRSVEPLPVETSSEQPAASFQIMKLPVVQIADEA